MFFRNLVVFTFPVNFPGLLPTPVADELGDLHSRLAEHTLKPVGPLEMLSQGFISPHGRDGEHLVHECGNMRWLTVGQEKRVLPPSVVNDLLAKKLDEIEAREGRVPSGRTRKRVKDELMQELLPRAFVQPRRTDAYLDLERGIFAVDASSRGAAEQLVSEVRKAIGSFPALPLNAEVAPRSVLTGWLAGEELPEGFSLGDACELRDAIDDGSTVRIQNASLDSEEVRGHLEAGLQCTRLALVLEDRISFVLGEDLILRKLRFLDGAVDELENTSREDLRAELDARFALMSGELGQLLDKLGAALKLTPAEGRGATVTISAGGESVTVSADEFKNAAGAFQRYQEALGIVRETGNCSISHLQRRMKIGYNAAARLLEAMEQRGVITSPGGDGKRTLTPAGTR